MTGVDFWWPLVEGAIILIATVPFAIVILDIIVSILLGRRGE